MIDVDALEPGQQLPTFSREGTFQHWNRFAAVNDEFAEHHMDDEVGRHEGFSSAFIMAPMEHAYFHAMLRDWMGEAGRIVRVDMKLRNPLLRGRVLTAGGQVTAVHREGDEVVVDLEIWEDDDTGARLAPGTAVVAFAAPRRASAPPA
ncbi:MAG: hypothetical protein JF603_06820 [Acidobacteria bacterium]|nr:hypothetical protein [Acidobacteriota bacterium]